MQGDDEKLIVVGIKKVFLLWRKTSRPHNTKSRALEYINNILIIFFFRETKRDKIFCRFADKNTTINLLLPFLTIEENFCLHA